VTGHHESFRHCEISSRVRISIVVLFVTLLSGCAVPGASSNSAKIDQVAAATAAWRAAYDSRDPARIIGQYAADAVLWGTSAKTVAVSPSGIADYFKDAAKRPNARVTFGEQQIRVLGDIGVNTGYYTFSDARDGKATSVPARFSMVFHQSGKWLIVDHHSSRVP